MTTPTSNAPLGGARDLLPRLRSAYYEAVASFTWPEVGPSFSFAHSFDGFVGGHHGPGLVIVAEDGSRSEYLEARRH